MEITRCKNKKCNKFSTTTETTRPQIGQEFILRMQRHVNKSIKTFSNGKLDFFRLQIIPTCDQHVNKFSKDQSFQVDKWFYLSPVTFDSAKNLHSFVCGLLRRIWIGIDIDKQSLLLIRLLRSLCKWILPIYLNWLKSTAYLTSEGDYFASEFW